MINNRLFKKINSVFWAILTWLPIVLFILATAFQSFQFIFNSASFISGDIGVSDYLNEFFVAASFVISNQFDFWYNPLSDVFYNLFEILDTVGSGQFYFALSDMCAWACWVQVMRLFAYVFMWFIDLLTSLFDYLSFNKRGDN